MTEPIKFEHGGEFKIKTTKLPRKLKKKLKKEHKIHLTAYYKPLVSVNKVNFNFIYKGE